MGTLTLQTEIDAPVSKITFLEKNEYLEFAKLFPQINSKVVAQQRINDLSSEFTFIEEENKDSIHSLNLSRILEENKNSVSTNFEENQDAYVFQVRRQIKSNLKFMGVQGFRTFSLIFQFIDELHLWGVSIVQESFNQNQRPDEFFMLDSVEQILVGIDKVQTQAAASRNYSMFQRLQRVGTVANASQVAKEDHKYQAIFTMKQLKKRAAPPVAIQLPSLEEKERFCAVVQHIATHCKKYKQFLTESITMEPAPVHLRLMSQFSEHLMPAWIDELLSLQSQIVSE